MIIAGLLSSAYCALKKISLTLPITIFSLMVVPSCIIATGVSLLPLCMKISMIASSLLMAINIITVADDCAASFISGEISPDLVVPVVTQKLSLIPLQVSGIIWDAG